MKAEKLVQMGGGKVQKVQAKYLKTCISKMLLQRDLMVKSLKTKALRRVTSLEGKVSFNRLSIEVSEVRHSRFIKF